MCSFLREYLSKNPLTPRSFWLHAEQRVFPSPPGHKHEADNHLEVGRRRRSSLSRRPAPSQLSDVQPDVTVIKCIALICMPVRSACYNVSGKDI